MPHTIHSYYITQDYQKLIGIEPSSNGIVVKVTGPFTNFDPIERILISTNDELHLPITCIEKSSFLRNRTELYLKSLTK
jgi:hypothetical protein